MHNIIHGCGVQLSMRFLYDIAVAIQALHSEGIVHNNINSTKLMVGSDKLVLVDFGCSFVKGDKCPQRIALRWAAPETLDNLDRSNFASDIYPLGMAMWECVTGMAPFNFGNSYKVRDIIKQDFSGLVGNASPNYRDLISKQTQYKPSYPPATNKILALVPALNKSEHNVVTKGSLPFIKFSLNAF